MIVRITAVLSCAVWLSTARNDDAIPVIEIRGEGKPMSSAQIRNLEETANGGPLENKIERRWKPKDCKIQAKRYDWITFHYKLHLEDGRRLHQTYEKDPITIQLGTGMTIPGLDSALHDVCETEVMRVSVPWRLAQKDDKGKVWEHLPSEEHWLRFDIEVVDITPFSLAEQFKALDRDGDAAIDENDLIAYASDMKENYGRGLLNEDVDRVLAAKYYIKYFDIDGNGKVDFGEFQKITERDQKLTKEKVRPEAWRDPGLAWILDFNNDGGVDKKEIDEAPERIEKGPTLMPNNKDEL